MSIVFSANVGGQLEGFAENQNLACLYFITSHNFSFVKEGITKLFFMSLSDELISL